MNGWAGSTDWKHVPDILVSDGSVGTGWVAAPYQPETPNYAIGAQIQLLGAALRINELRFGLLARTMEQGTIVGGVDWDEATIASALYYASDYDYFGYNIFQSPIASQPFNPGVEWHTYRLEVKGNAIKLLLDGAPLVDGVDNTILLNGQVGLFSFGAQISVRSFKVIQL
jgi:hypothetical protein